MFKKLITKTNQYYTERVHFDLKRHIYEQKNTGTFRLDARQLSECRTAHRITIPWAPTPRRM